MRKRLSPLIATACLWLPGACTTTDRLVQGEQKAGPPMRYATAGTSLIHEEIDRTRHPTRSEDVAIRYRLWARGFPQDRPYSLWLERFVVGTAESQPVVERLRVGLDDIVTTASGAELQFALVREGERTTDPDVLARVPEGHSVILTLVSNDRKVESWTRLVPFPIEAFGQTGCRISVESEFADRLAVTIVGERFQADEEVDIQSVSGGEIIRSRQRATGQGSFKAVMFPQVAGGRKGTAVLTASGGRCSVTTHFHWGE